MNLCAGSQDLWHQTGFEAKEKRMIRATRGRGLTYIHYSWISFHTSTKVRDAYKYRSRHTVCVTVLVQKTIITIIIIYYFCVASRLTHRYCVSSICLHHPRHLSVHLAVCLVLHTLMYLIQVMHTFLGIILLKVCSETWYSCSRSSGNMQDIFIFVGVSS